MWIVVLDWTARLLVGGVFSVLLGLLAHFTYTTIRNRVFSPWATILATLGLVAYGVFIFMAAFTVITTKTDFRMEHEGKIIKCPTCGQDYNPSRK